jgi:hypothetical protein
LVLVEKWSKVYAEDPECEYALSLQRDIQQASVLEANFWMSRTMFLAFVLSFGFFFGFLSFKFSNIFHE